MKDAKLRFFLYLHSISSMYKTYHFNHPQLREENKQTTICLSFVVSSYSYYNAFQIIELSSPSSFVNPIILALCVQFIHTQRHFFFCRTLIANSSKEIHLIFSSSIICSKINVRLDVDFIFIFSTECRFNNKVFLYDGPFVICRFFFLFFCVIGFE